MHFLALAFKRAHWRSIALARPTAERLGLTPARFELCDFVRSCGSPPRQFMIKRALGVSAVTVSKMVRRLAELGLVERIKIGRAAFVGLTKEGKRRVAAVIKEVIAPFHFSEKFESSWGTRSEQTANVARMVSRYVRAVIWKLGGRATYWLPRPKLARGEIALDFD